MVQQYGIGVLWGITIWDDIPFHWGYLWQLRMVSFPAVQTPGVPSRPFTPRSQVQGGMGAAKQEWGWVKTYELTIFWGISIPAI